MAGEARKSWRDLCNAALEAEDPDELMTIAQELNRVLKHEEQVRRDFREGRSSRPTSPMRRSDVNGRKSGVNA
jgi:hypothetical protein